MNIDNEFLGLTRPQRWQVIACLLYRMTTFIDDSEMRAYWRNGLLPLMVSVSEIINAGPALEALRSDSPPRQGCSLGKLSRGQLAAIAFREVVSLLNLSQPETALTGTITNLYRIAAVADERAPLGDPAGILKAQALEDHRLERLIRLVKSRALDEDSLAVLQ